MAVLAVAWTVPSGWLPPPMTITRWLWAGGSITDAPISRRYRSISPGTELNVLAVESQMPASSLPSPNVETPL